MPTLLAIIDCLLTSFGSCSHTSHSVSLSSSSPSSLSPLPPLSPHSPSSPFLSLLPLYLSLPSPLSLSLPLNSTPEQPRVTVVERFLQLSLYVEKNVLYPLSFLFALNLSALHYQTRFGELLVSLSLKLLPYPLSLFLNLFATIRPLIALI